MIEKSCGTIPYTINNGTVYYLLVKAKDDGYCGFPKGHVEMSESEEETAFRETLEETSVNVQINSDFRYKISYQMDTGNTKTIVYFLAKFQNQTPKRNKDFEDFDYLLLPFDSALQELTFENTRKMLKAANAFLTDTALQSLPCVKGGGTRSVTEGL
ncbi:MAG: NUDIX domain-containing protein [Clostridia bacterium]|nr:NUDIX domain-containing protein [Clostridia bacterium]